jgi:hypothetical protein
VAHWIETAPEPQCLFLAWQAPDHMGDRFRWAVGVLERTTDGDCSLRYFQPGPDFEARNQGRSFDRLRSLGYQGYPAFPLKKERYEGGVLPAFMRRLPPRTRPDFLEYKRQFRLPSHVFVSNFTLLGRTEAKLPSDGFSVVDPLDGDIKRCDLLLEVAGYRYYAEQTRVSVDEPVIFQPEPGNEHDQNAVMVQVRGQKIGYVNRLQTSAFKRLLAEQNVSSVVERLNGRPGKARAFIFVWVRPR